MQEKMLSFSILNYQFSIVILIILAALTFATVSIIKKRKSFSTKHGCDHDCGCGK